MINQRIGAFIAVLRKEQGMTQEQFAERLGVSNRSVSRWENGNTLPDLSMMQLICQITGITLSELLSGARQDPSGEAPDSALAVLALWDREKLAKLRSLNGWFGLGLVTLLAAVMAAAALGRAEGWLLAGLGYGIGFRCQRPAAMRKNQMM